MTTSKSKSASRVAAVAPRTEAEIVAKLVALLPMHFGVQCAIATEVRSHGTARTDVALVDGAEVIAIEVKRADWHRLVGQAYLNRLCADRSYVAVWSGCLSPILRREARRWGLGLLAVSADSLELIEAAPLASPNEAVRERMAATIAAGAVTA